MTLYEVNLELISYSYIITQKNLVTQNGYTTMTLLEALNSNRRFRLEGSKTWYERKHFGIYAEDGTFKSGFDVSEVEASWEVEKIEKKYWARIVADSGDSIVLSVLYESKEEAKSILDSELIEVKILM